MRNVHSALIARLSGAWTRLHGRRQPGQVVILTAMMLTVLMGLAGAGVDYGLIVAEKARLQNALDASALAGARALITSSASTQTARNAAGEAAAASYLTLHGYTSGANGATFTYSESASDGGAFNDTMTVVGTVALPTRFWRVIGITTTNLNQRAVAAAGAGMVDVMLSLDLSGSMELSGTNDLGQLRAAVVAFINQMQIDPTDPRSTKVGIARWAGARCSWWRGYSGGALNQGADWDTNIDFDRGPGGQEYSTPCNGDYTVVTGLTQNKNMLIKVADGSGAGTCPTGMSAYACPLVSWRLPASQIPVAYGTPTAATGVQARTWYGMTGTKLPNAIEAVNSGSYYAWSTANGGRNDAATTGISRKVLVMMTDGFNEGGTEPLPLGINPATWDAEVVTRATALKLGPDGIAGTWDDVEIYVVGFFCTPQNSMYWCASALADTSLPHKCPGNTWPTTGPAPSGIDVLLQSVSSSTAGTCDHYFPIKKTEDLPQLFRVMAGSIARGRLQ